MKKFEHDNRTYSIQNRLLYKLDGSVWAYTPYVTDTNLRSKATANGWRGDITENLIDDGFHGYKGKQKKA